MSFDKLKEKWSSEQEARRARARALKRRLLELGRPVFERYGIQKVVLFGSVADERCSTSSDLDILVLPLASDEYWSFLHDLREAVDERIDLYTEDDDPVFVRKILARGERVYEVQRGAPES